MNKETLYDLAMGVALVALSYALWQHFKTGATATPGTFTNMDPTKPDNGLGYDPYNPGEFISLTDLLKGTVADVIHNQTAGDAIPTTTDLIGSATADYYGTDYQPTTAPYKPGALW
jgi:hypothetical protein